LSSEFTPRTITIDPVTRIEGHAKITLQLDESGRIADARFHVVEYRGFETFCEGRPFTEMAGITARICGICPVSHLLAAAKTGDKLLAVQPPPAARKLRRKRKFLGNGAHLAIVITTLRCNQSCTYCHASRTDMDRVDTDMAPATVKGVVDHAMRTPSPYLCFEYQGGEPTVNLDAIKLAVGYSREKNRYEKKTLDHSVVTNMTYMTDSTADWLVNNGVLICTSLDGPREVHDRNRPWTGQKAGSFDTVVGWIKAINARYVAMGRDPELWHVDALTTTTRGSLPHGQAMVDQYVALGIRNIHLRPLNPFGFATKTWRVIGYSMEEWLRFYRDTVDYIIALNKQGVQIMEGTAAIFLKKMLTPDDPNFVDLRSPIGAGTGQGGKQPAGPDLAAVGGQPKDVGPGIGHPGQGRQAAGTHELTEPHGRRSPAWLPH
jgi:sulfatase maturation enzyme AslB (radical SAM superfamily)